MKWILALILSAGAYSSIDYTKGEWGSGGGNAIVCFPQGQIAIGDESYDVVQEIKNNDNKIENKFLPFIESIEMYDLYEAKKPRGISGVQPEILKIKPSESIYEYINRISERFKLYTPFLKYIIPEATKILPDESFIHHSYAIRYQNDMGDVTLPSENCVIATVAGQVNINGREDGFYEVHLDSRLFNHTKFSRQSKATLILHELIYAVSRKFFNHLNSSATRNIVRFYISYSELFTEGYISKSLDQLGYNFETTNPKIWKKYNFSSIMSTVGLHMKYLHESLKKSIGDAYYTDTNNDGQLDNSDRSIPEDMLRGWVLKDVDRVLIEMKNDLSSHSVVDADTLRIIEGKYRIHFNQFSYFAMDEVFNSFINIDEEDILKEIYTLFMDTVSCTSDVAFPIPTSNDEDNKQAECYDLLELNNVIPKI